MIERYMLGNDDLGWWGLDIDLQTKVATYHRNGHYTLPEIVPIRVRDTLCQMALHGSALENKLERLG